MRLSVMFILCCCGCSRPEIDVAAVRALHEAYVAAWLQNDSSGVLAVFDNQATLLPEGRMPVHGKSAIRDYWWPTGTSTTKIIGLAESVDEIFVDEKTAYIRGESDVRWEVVENGKVTSARQKGIFLKIAKRDTDGRWLISLQMWYQTESGKI